MRMKFSAKNLLCTLAFPLGMWLVCEIICRVFGNTTVFSNIVDFRTLIRKFVVSYSISLALSCNLPSGRFDMSLGAQQYLSVIVASSLGFAAGFGAATLLVGNLLFGLVIGFAVGLLFSKMRILPMVYGLGIALILECITYVYNDNGVTFFGREQTAVINSLGFIGVVTVLMIAVMTVLFNYTAYGYEKRAIEGNQLIAKDAGINILKNCILCYSLAGGLAAISGTFSTAYDGSLTPVLNNGTVALITAGMLPFMLGNFIGRWSNSMIGIAVASLTIQIYIIGLSKLMLSSSIQNILLYSAFLVFLIISANLYRFSYRKAKKARIAEAEAYLQSLQANNI